MLSCGFCRIPGFKPCHEQLWIDSRRHQRSGDHTDNQQSQSDSSPCLSFLFQRCSRKPSGDHAHHFRYGPLYKIQVDQKTKLLIHSCILYTSSLVYSQTFNKKVPQGPVTHLLISSPRWTRLQAEKNQIINQPFLSFWSHFCKSRLKASVCWRLWVIHLFHKPFAYTHHLQLKAGCIYMLYPQCRGKLCHFFWALLIKIDHSLPALQEQSEYFLWAWLHSVFWWIYCVV